MGAVFIWGRFAPALVKPNISYKKGYYGHMHSRLSEVKTLNNIDVLFLGSSHAYRGFDTRLFAEYGLNTFNLGSSAQTPTQTKLLLNRYLQNLNPKTVVYEVYPATFTIDGVESALDIIANDKNDFNSFLMALEIKNIKTFNTFLYGYIRDLLKLNNSYTEASIKGKDKYISGGFVEKEISYFDSESYQRNKEEIILNNSQLESFSDVISMIKEKNINLILVYAPIPRVNYNYYTNNEYFDEVMKSHGKYYNFNELLVLNDSLHFYDDHHLNQIGVELFNLELIEILKSEIMAKE